MTSYHDASNVYGSTLEQSNNLRATIGGVLSANLATRPGNLPPEDTTIDACILDPTDPNDYCPLGGDHRISEVVFLGANHVTWLRMHNLIANELRSFGNGWSEERLFQETRKIIGALQQHITYDEYLPAMLNLNYRSAFCLTPSCQVYSSQINGAIKNSFSTAVLRMGHSQIPSAIGYVSPNHNSISNFPLRNHFNRPNLYIREGGTRVDDMQRYVTSQGAAATDRQLELEIADHLFTDGVLSFDLGALNIQRGRDHGHHNDIDLYAGALSETPVPGGELGPTFSCLFALQLRDLKVGDRFFWSRPDPVTGFTAGIT
ncbi:hypothetical protein KUTeg_008881 [Tegillarca granosa]|uniref:Peroxidase n=1 Tax=Tegillarca granosa TaxID=220873 RepID=A0ABQ9FDF1_TEGGR|nr:hypothetical protein KUTeg_008881 [Tegillarca granosa]